MISFHLEYFSVSTTLTQPNATKNSLLSRLAFLRPQNRISWPLVLATIFVSIDSFSMKWTVRSPTDGSII